MALEYADEVYRLELTNFRAFNIENVAEGEKPEFRNVGPSYGYKLRDAAGQAREYNNYMLPMQVEGRWMMMTGMREDPNDQFRYLRVPLDEDGRLDSYWMLRAALLDESVHREIANRFASSAATGETVSATMRERLAESAERVAETFSRRGFEAVAQFLEQAVPEPEREQAAEVYLRVLQGVGWQAWQQARERAGLKPLEATPERARFVHDALNAVSDSFHYGVPVYLALAQYDEVKASVFQLTRSPGQNTVYLGCALLIAGVFVMLYIRERRVWIIAKPGGQAVFGMQCNRKTLDFDAEFARHRGALSRLMDGKAPHGTG